MTNFLGYSQTKVVKRQTIIEDIVIVMDGSGSVGYCEFKKGKEALKHMMKTLHNPRIAVSKFAAVTFASTVTVNFKFLPYLTAASKITNIPYPSGMTNTQAGLAEAKRLFDDPGSGILKYICRQISFALLGMTIHVDSMESMSRRSSIFICQVQNTPVKIYKRC